jgi:hypothetical protein
VVGHRDLVQERSDGLAEDRRDADRQPLRAVQMVQKRRALGDPRDGVVGAVRALGEQAPLPQAAGECRIAAGVVQAEQFAVQRGGGQVRVLTQPAGGVGIERAEGVGGSGAGLAGSRTPAG